MDKVEQLKGLLAYEEAAAAFRDAKAARLADPSDETEQAYREAKAALQPLRAFYKANRQAPNGPGDAVVSGGI